MMVKKTKQTEVEQWVEQVIMKEEYYDLEETKPAKKTKKPKEVWPKVIQGSHSTRIEHEDGRVEFHIDWEALQRDVKAAILKYESTMPVSDTTVEKVKKTKNKKV